MSCSDYAIAALQTESPHAPSPPNVTGKSGMYVADVAWYGAV